MKITSAGATPNAIASDSESNSAPILLVASSSRAYPAVQAVEHRPPADRGDGQLVVAAQRELHRGKARTRASTVIAWAAPDPGVVLVGTVGPVRQLGQQGLAANGVLARLDPKDEGT